jgi:hypothetical protein
MPWSVWVAARCLIRNCLWAAAGEDVHDAAVVPLRLERQVFAASARRANHHTHGRGQRTTKGQGRGVCTSVPLARTMFACGFEQFTQVGGVARERTALKGDILDRYPATFAPGEWPVMNPQTTMEATRARALTGTSQC